MTPPTPSTPAPAGPQSHNSGHNVLGWSRAPLPGAPVAGGQLPRAAAGSTVSIGEFFALLRRRLVTALLVFLLCLIAAFGLLSVATKQYDAVSAVKVAPIKGDSDTAGGISTITESRIVTSTAVAARASKTLKFSGTLEDLLSHVSVSSPLNSLLIYVTYTAESPQTAARGANAFASAYLAYRKSVGDAQLNGQIGVISTKIAALQQKLNDLPKGAPGSQSSALQAQIDRLNASLYAVNTTIVIPGQVVGIAQPPSAPTSPKKILYIAAGVLAGLVLGTVGALIKDRRDDKLHGPSDLEHLIDAPVLTTVVSRRRAADPPVVPEFVRDGEAGTADDAAEVDAYRTLATKLRAPITGMGPTAFLLVRGGATKEEQAPFNLAAMFARQGVPTALVTTTRGLRHVAPVFGKDPVPANVDESLAPVPSVPNLWLLSLGSEDEMDSTIGNQRAVIDRLLDLVEVALVDGINVDRASSVLTLGRLSPAAVVVATDRRTAHAEIARSVRELAQVGTRPLGGVLFARRPRRFRRRRRPQVASVPAATPELAAAVDD